MYGDWRNLQRLAKNKIISECKDFRFKQKGVIKRMEVIVNVLFTKQKIKMFLKLKLFEITYFQFLALM